MSHIDSWDHEFVGTLGYLPIYHPLQDIPKAKWGDPDFGATPANLVLGGGSGEHPGLVLHRLECFVAHFLADQLSDKDEEKLSEEAHELLAELTVDHDELFEYCGWRIDQKARFYQMAQSAAFMNPLGEGEPLEYWLLSTFGELVYYAMPELNPYHEELKGIFAPFEIYPTMSNVRAVPHGYRKEGGRIVEDGKLTWGIHRF